MQTGIKGHTEQIVDERVTADTVGSGLLSVFATPAMIALIEKTAWESIADEMEPGQGTVGTKVDVAHISATPIGMKVWCDTELVEVDNRRLVFSVTVYDEAGKIGEGTHERFIIYNDKFKAKAYEKIGATP